MTESLASGTEAVALCHERPQHARTVLVDWMLGNACSFACSYCPSALHDGSIAWQKTEDVLAFFDHMHRHYVERLGRRLWLQFTGGEPTMHPGIVEVLDRAAERGFQTSLISNASRTPRFWHRVRDRLSSVILTYHDEFVDHEHFLKVLEIVAGAMPVHVNVTMHPERFEQIFEKAQDIARVAPESSLSLKPLRVGFGNELYSYSEEQRDLLETRLTSPGGLADAIPRSVMRLTRRDGSNEMFRANSLILQDLNRWEGWRCQIGLECLRIKADGRINRAVCGVGGEIGHLGHSPELPMEPTTCTRTHCSCLTDILTTKFRDM